MRADARRNRERILAAAKKVFAELGSEARWRRGAPGGGGRGTLYRHFPTKEILLGELIHLKLSEFAAHVPAQVRGQDRPVGGVRGLPARADRRHGR